MRRPRLTVLVAALAFAAACDSGDGASGRPPGTPAGDSVAAPGAITWLDDVEPMILAPTQANERGLVVGADSLAPDLDDGALERTGSLFRLDGSIVSVRVSLNSDSEGCVGALLEPAPVTSWGVGFVGRPPTPVRVDSLAGISRQDSMRLAPVMFRLASSVPNSPGGRFSGLPFVLVELWRFRAADGSPVIVATTRRQINQEDSPMEERTLLIAESDSTEADFSLVHSSRSTGPEETVEGAELLAVVTLGGRSQPHLVFSHDFGNETSYSIIARRSRGSWTTFWVSRRFTC